MKVSKEKYEKRINELRVGDTQALGDYKKALDDITNKNLNLIAEK